MKKVVAALVTFLAVVDLGMPTPSPAQDSTVDTTAKTRKTVATPRRMAAEVLAVNRGADALTVRSVANGKETDVIFSVQGKNRDFYFFKYRTRIKRQKISIPGR